MATGLLATQLLEQFQAMSRAPFRDELARLMKIPRSPKAYRAWANRFPDRHAQAVAIYARLAGYSERIEVEHTGLLGLVAQVKAMSDSELEARYRASRSPDALTGKESLALASGSVVAELPPPVVVEAQAP